MSPLSAPRPPVVELMAGLGLDPDPWQLDVLEGGHARLLLNCCRQAGKSTVVAMLTLAQTVWTPGTIVLLVSRSQRQSEKLFHIMTDAYRRLPESVGSGQEAAAVGRGQEAGVRDRGSGVRGQAGAHRERRLLSSLEQIGLRPSKSLSCGDRHDTKAGRVRCESTLSVVAASSSSAS